MFVLHRGGELTFLLCILYVPFVCSVLSDDEKADTKKKALLSEIILIARIYPAGDYEEFKDRPDTRSEEDYYDTYYPRQSLNEKRNPRQDGLKPTKKKKERQKERRKEFRESVFAVGNVYNSIRHSYMDQAHEESRKEFYNISESYRSFIQEKLKNKELLQWPRIVYYPETKTFKVIPEKFLPRDMTVKSEIDYAGELPTISLEYIDEWLPTGNEEVSFNLDFIENLNSRTKEILIKKLKKKVGGFDIYHMIPVSSSLKFTKSYFVLRDYIYSQVVQREQALLSNKTTAMDKLLRATINKYFESSIEYDPLDETGNLFFGPSGKNVSDNLKKFGSHLRVFFPTLDNFTIYLKSWQAQKEILRKYRLLKGADLKDEKTNPDKQKKILDNLILDDDGKPKNRRKLIKIFKEFSEIRNQRLNTFEQVLILYGLTDKQPIPFDPTMWEIAKNGSWHLRTVEERNAKYIPGWLDKIIRKIEAAGITMNRALRPKNVPGSFDFPGVVLIFDDCHDSFLVYSDPYVEVRNKYKDMGYYFAYLLLAYHIVETDPDTIAKEMYRVREPTSNEIHYVAKELREKNPNPRILNITRFFCKREEKGKLTLLPPLREILRMPGRPEDENYDYALAASFMGDTLLCDPATRIHRVTSELCDDTTLVEILTFGTVDVCTINEKVYRQLVNEYQSLALEIRSNASLVEYMKKEITNETSNSFLRNVILRNICLAPTTTTISNVGHICESDLYWSLLGTVAGCTAGALTGTFVFPLLGTPSGCIAGGLIGLVSGMAGGRLFPPENCTIVNIQSDIAELIR